MHISTNPHYEVLDQIAIIFASNPSLFFELQISEPTGMSLTSLLTVLQFIKEYAGTDIREFLSHSPKLWPERISKA